MRYIKSMIVVFMLFASVVYGQEDEEKFPKDGYVRNNGAAVKAGDNENFENLCTLSKADPVKIIGRRYSWLKILLPKKAALYINSDYVMLTSDEKGVGVVSASNVNIRAGAGTRYAIVGQISKPEKVSILSEDSGWYKIEPPYGASGWIHSDQIDITIAEKAAEPLEQKETTGSSTIRLNANSPAPAKGNLSISTSTKNNR